jgi:hypothetical protein
MVAGALLATFTPPAVVNAVSCGDEYVCECEDGFCTVDPEDCLCACARCARVSTPECGVVNSSSRCHLRITAGRLRVGGSWSAAVGLCVAVPPLLAQLIRFLGRRS